MMMTLEVVCRTCCHINDDNIHHNDNSNNDNGINGNELTGVSKEQQVWLLKMSTTMTTLFFNDVDMAPIFDLWIQFLVASHIRDDDNNMTVALRLCSKEFTVLLGLNNILEP